ncbi:hypothetical protein [Roseateles sp. PN1]|uniref:hypothetical protein n=1 Tax=Roseateles sp. PN1 TaxID=3137372 RepID=UPI00313972DE
MDFVDLYRLVGLALLVGLVLGTRRAFTLSFLACANFALYAFLKPVIISEYFQSGTQVPQYAIGAFCVFLLGTLLGRLLCDELVAPPPPPEVVVMMPNVYLPALAGVALVTLHLALVGQTPISAIADPISARWALGNGGNILLQTLWTNVLIVTSIYIFFAPAPLAHRLLAVVISLAWFPLLSIRAPLVDFVLTVIVIKCFLVGRRGFSPLAALTFAAVALLLIAALGVVRLSSQTGKSLEEIIGAAPDLINVSGLLLDLILQRLDYLDVMQAAETSLYQLQLPPIPFLYNLLPRGLFVDKLYSSDTQATALAGPGFDEENITRIVGIVAEMMSSDLMLVFGVAFLFLLGVLYKVIDNRGHMTRGRLFLYARILPAAGGLPLLGGWNTIYMSSFALNLMMSALIVRLYEKSFPVTPANR